MGDADRPRHVQAGRVAVARPGPSPSLPHPNPLRRGEGAPVAVLASGGVDSSILIAELSREAVVHPIYVRAGLVWEDAEITSLEAFIAALRSSNVRPVTALEARVQPLLGEHWSVTGRGVPGSDEPDEAMFIPGRNVLLLSLAAIWCSTHGVHRVAIGSLGGNPFPDATPEFFRAFGDALSAGLAHRIAIEAPFRNLHKDALLQQHRDLPLHLTLTCARPQGGRHCGACNKCEERRSAFRSAGVPDRTSYAAGGVR